MYISSSIYRIAGEFGGLAVQNKTANIITVNNNAIIMVGFIILQNGSISHYISHGIKTVGKDCLEAASRRAKSP